jgi:competence protein ComEC
MPLSVRDAALFCLLVGMNPVPALQVADTLDIWVIDADGGKAEIIKTPSGQAVLIDAGFPRPDDRDIKRIELAAKDAGITAFDYLIISHYDVDHAGNVPAISTHFNFKAYVDHGPMINDPNMNPANKRAADAYFAFIAGENRMTVKPGDVLPLQDVKVTILTSNEQVLSKPLPGAGKPNTACPETPPVAAPSDDNSGSVGELWEFGKFKMADFGDLLKWVENRLVCPMNQVGPVDLFMVNHHGVVLSNSAKFVAALHPKVAIMNNGDRKGNAVATVNTLRAQPGLQDVWQLHFSSGIAPELNARENFIANMKATDDEAKWIKVSARKDGSFTITNTRNGFSKEYK